MKITRELLLEAIEAATMEVEVCVPSRDYYARAGDFTTETISFVDPQKFAEFFAGIDTHSEAL